MNKDFEHVRAALRGETELDETVLERVLWLAESVQALKINETLACAAAINQKVTLLSEGKGLREIPENDPKATLKRATQDFELAGMLKSMKLLLMRAGVSMMPCRHCKGGTAHSNTCPLAQALTAWKDQLIPGKAKVRS